jgi:hypothetical protein
MRHHCHAAVVGILIAGSAAAQQSWIVSSSNYADTASPWYPVKTYCVTYVAADPSYSGLQFRLDLVNGDWHTFCLNWDRDGWTNEWFPATNTVLFPEPWGWLSNTHTLFFRAVCSSDHLVPTVTTNRVTFSNDSPSAVSNVWLGLWGNGDIENVVTVTSLPPHSASSAYDYVLEDPSTEAVSSNWGWFQGGYMQGGVQKELNFNWEYRGPLLRLRTVRFTASSYEIE